jgi:hypothetical protein
VRELLGYRFGLSAYKLKLDKISISLKKGEPTMANEEKEYKKELTVKWIKATSGNTYLCPVDALKRLENPSEEQLKMICVDESKNPENA